MPERAFTFPPEHYEFERQGRYLFFDPQNFVWFQTDWLGKTVVNSLQREGAAEGAAAQVAAATKGELAHARIYVDKWLDRLFEVGFLHRDQYGRQLPRVMVGRHPTEMYVHLTTRCNLRCLYCYNLDHRDLMRRIEQGRREQFLALVDEAAEIGFEKIRLTGGEALLNPDALAIARRANERGLSVNLLTNGTLVTPEVAAEVAQVVDTVSISLDSAVPEEHDLMRGRGSHAKVLRSIALVKQAGVKWLHLNAVVTPANKASVSRFLKLAWDELGADQVVVVPSEAELPDPRNRLSGVPYVLTPDEIEEVYAEESAFYRRRGWTQARRRPDLWRCQCGAGNGVVSVEANGDLYPCQTMHDPEFLCGNVFRDGLGTVLASSGRLEEIRNLTVDTIDGCQRCAMRYICAGGCRTMAFYREGRVDARDRRYCRSLFQGALDQLWRAVEQSDPAAQQAPTGIC